MQHHLKDKTAWITGGASGIGLATAKRFAAEGAKIAITDVNEEGLVKAAKAIGGDVFTMTADVSNREQVQATAKAIVDKFGRLDILIANAGITRDGLSLKMSEDKWDLVLDVNLKGTFLCCQAAMRHMMSQKSGRIVTTASVASLGNPGQVNYSAAKAGIIGLTKTLAVELAHFGIRVNCVAPGATDTPMLQELKQEMRDQMLQMIPLKKFSRPEDIAAAHLFFCSDDASLITGQVLFVDGGMTTGI
ncbi:3-oxoacyl-ACP reductase [candidate division LCP-89 bacterium B3_LCP]|uniref:3-oxoacyl-[acyl-carrier-protein] reductase FabG n=1 Tax=candidate division LCP-89 bacterium B3_LCP TaxID=2012998 RepID=A0A532UPJ9_UNCL8|nr:MAG: 3-oxoacyl-ACP reductase [candidate division LCP-89 bacterium B3_LCP]